MRNPYGEGIFKGDGGKSILLGILVMSDGKKWGKKGGRGYY
jgi:hypothetical protein